MTTSSIIIYRHPSERLAARLGRALVRWADTRAVVTHERRAALLANERAVGQLRHSAAARQFLRG